MLQARVTRIGILISVAGLAVLSASLFHWARTTPSQGLFYSTDLYEWVASNARANPAIARDEIWDLPASCVKQFYVKEIDNLKSQLSTHNATKPPAVVVTPLKPKSYYDPETQRTIDAMERRSQAMQLNYRAIDEVAKVLGPYDQDEYQSLSKALDQNNLAIDPVWFTTRFHLEYLIKKWTADAASLDNKRILRSDVVDAAQRGNSPKLSGLGVGMSLKIADAKTSEAKMDVAATYLLSLTAFSDSVALTIRTTCVEATRIKQIVSETSYGTDIERWPVESPLFFWTGIALAVSGLLLGPTFMWVRAAK